MDQHDRIDQTKHLLPRRKFLALSGMGAASALFLMACGTDDETPAATATPVAPTTGNGGNGTAPVDAQVLVGDVLDYHLEPDGWTGDFGGVTFRLHHALVNGEDAYYIRTDASDREFAQEHGLVFVPLMANALRAPSGLGAIYVFEDPATPAVINSAPHLGDYSPAFRVINVIGDAEALDSAEAIEAAAEAGSVSLTPTDVVVNYPVVKWPGGELPHDDEREIYLGDGQLLEPVDVAGMTVTFKLHKCYPNSRYIVTDSTMMADMMRIAPAPTAQGLTDVGATADILVFGNGVEGSGPMGAQKSVTDTIAGEPNWSPFWDHFTYVWADGADAELLRTAEEIQAAVAAGHLTRFNGVPDSHPTGFMVNCPVPVIADVA